MRYARQNKILDIISNHEVETQEKLLGLLKEEGFAVTQATISRDIKELHLIKVLSATGKYKYAVSSRRDLPVSERFLRIFRETVISFTAARNLIVLKTLPGCGPAAGEAIDSVNLPHILGCVAGSNTLLLVADNDENVKEILSAFNNMLIRKNLD